jgi:Spy/CpxP family protein refolding chaperone
MWRKTTIAVTSALSLILMSASIYAQPQAHHSWEGAGQSSPQATGGGMMGMCPMCGGMMGSGMMGMMGQGMGDMMGMLDDPAFGVLHQFGGPGFYSRWAAQLDLSEDQQQSLEGLWNTHLKNGIRKRADLQIAQLELKIALGKGVPDYEEAKAKIKAISDLREEIALAHLSAIQKARKVLTSEQLDKLKTLRRTPMGRQGMMMPMGKQQGTMHMHLE